VPPEEDPDRDTIVRWLVSFIDPNHPRQTFDWHLARAALLFAVGLHERGRDPHVARALRWALEAAAALLEGRFVLVGVRLRDWQEAERLFPHVVTHLGEPACADFVVDNLQHFRRVREMAPLVPHVLASLVERPDALTSRRREAMEQLLREQAASAVLPYLEALAPTLGATPSWPDVVALARQAFAARDHAGVPGGLRALLEAHPSLAQVVGQALDEKTLRALNEHDPEGLRALLLACPCLLPALMAQRGADQELRQLLAGRADFLDCPVDGDDLPTRFRLLVLVDVAEGRAELHALLGDPRFPLTADALAWAAQTARRSLDAMVAIECAVERDLLRALNDSERLRCFVRHHARSRERLAQVDARALVDACLDVAFDVLVGRDEVLAGLPEKVEAHEMALLAAVGTDAAFARAIQVLALWTAYWDEGRGKFDRLYNVLLNVPFAWLARWFAKGLLGIDRITGVLSVWAEAEPKDEVRPIPADLALLVADALAAAEGVEVCGWARARLLGWCLGAAWRAGALDAEALVERMRSAETRSPAWLLVGLFEAIPVADRAAAVIALLDDCGHEAVTALRVDAGWSARSGALHEFAEKHVQASRNAEYFSADEQRSAGVPAKAWDEAIHSLFDEVIGRERKQPTDLLGDGDLDACAGAFEALFDAHALGRPTWAVPALVRGAACRVLRLVEAALAERPRVVRSRVREAIGERFPNRVVLGEALAAAGLSEADAKVVLDRAADERLPRLLRVAIGAWLPHPVEHWSTDGEPETQAAHLVEAAFGAYREHPAALARVLVKLVSEQKPTERFHLMRAMLIALGELRETVGSAVPRVLAGITLKEGAWVPQVRLTAENQKARFERAHIKRGRATRADLRVRAALNELRRGTRLALPTPH
jgi:hypothetical protein